MYFTRRNKGGEVQAGIHLLCALESSWFKCIHKAQWHNWFINSLMETPVKYNPWQSEHADRWVGEWMVGWVNG